MNTENLPKKIAIFPLSNAVVFPKTVLPLNIFEERNWINKIIKINNTEFKVLKNIPRCSATNLKINSVEMDINLPNLLKKTYGHIDIGIYLVPLKSGQVKIGDNISF